MSEAREVREFNIAHAPHDLSEEFSLEQRQIWLNEATRVERLEAGNGQHFSAIVMNRQHQGAAVPIVSPNEFMSDVTRPEKIWQAVQFAAAFPDRPLVFIDTPGHGFSSRHNRDQVEGLTKSGSVWEVANPMLSAVVRRMEGDREMHLLGLSYGARVALSMAALNNRARTLIGFELPGLVERNTQKIQFDAVIRERLRRKQYVKSLERHGLLQPFEDFAAVVSQRGLIRAGHFYRNDRRMALANHRSTPLAFPTAHSELKVTLSRGASVYLANGSESLVGNPDRLRELRKELSVDQRKRLHLAVLPGDNHNLGMAQLIPRLAWHAQRAFEQLQLGR